MLKKLFGGKAPERDAATLTIDDLIVLERYEEAESRLHEKLKSNPGDLHSRLKLAEVYVQQRHAAKAIDEFIFVAEEYAADGFHDKGIALLGKAMRLAPADDTLRVRIEKLKTGKRLDHARVQAIEGMLQRASITGSGHAGTSALELQRLWGNIEDSPLVRALEADQLKRLFASMDLVRIGADVPVVEKGASLEELYLIVEGIIEAGTPRAGQWSVLRAFSSGDIIGDRALFERKPWACAYRTINTVTIMRLTRPGLEQALQGNPDPKALIDALRAGRHDQDVATLLAQLGVR